MLLQRCPMGAYFKMQQSYKINAFGHDRIISISSFTDDTYHVSLADDTYGNVKIIYDEDGELQSYVIKAVRERY